MDATLGIELAIDRIASLQEAADDAHFAAEEAKRTPKILPELSDTRRMAVFHNGKLDHVDRTPPDRTYRVLTVDDFADACRRYGAADDAAVFINMSEVVLLMGDPMRLETVTFRLELADSFKKVEELVRGRAMAHAEFLRFVRTTIGDYLEDSSIIELARKISFRNKMEGQSQIGPGAASLGRSVEMELHGVEGQDFPEHLWVLVPIFLAPLDAIKERLRIDLQIDFEEQRFLLAASGDVLAQAKLNALKLVRGQVVAALGKDFDEKRVLLGTPK